MTTRAQPSIASLGGDVSAVFHGDDFKHYYAGYAASWSPTAEPVGGTSSQSFGPSPATIAALSSGPIIAFAGNDGDLYDQARVGGVWQSASGHGLGNVLSQPPTIPPAIVALTSGPDLMIVFAEQDKQIRFTTHTSATGWSTPLAIANCLTGDPVALAPLPNGGAILAFRGTDFNLYWSVYSASGWSKVAGFASPNVSVDTTPAVTHGIGGDTAEIAYLIGGVAYHARLSGSAWLAPVTVGGTALNGVALAAAP